MDKKRDLLKNIYLFQSFSDQEIHKIAKIAKNHDFTSGQRIFYEGDEAVSFFVIEMGTVQMTKKSREAEQEDVVVLASGAHFGELPFLDGAKRSMTAIAKERCEILEISYADLEKTLQADPQIAADFYREVAHFLAARLRKITENLADAKSMRHHL